MPSGSRLKTHINLTLNTMKSTHTTINSTATPSLLAMLYYPHLSYKRAVHLFRQELRLTRGLLDALKRVGYRENQRVLTPRQVQVIEEYLGEP
jgi:hypothetical protein